jgi:hypothetical protein
MAAASIGTSGRRVRHDEAVVGMAGEVLSSLVEGR